MFWCLSSFRVGLWCVRARVVVSALRKLCVCVCVCHGGEGGKGREMCLGLNNSSTTTVWVGKCSFAVLYSPVRRGLLFYNNRPVLATKRDWYNTPKPWSAKGRQYK